MNLDGTDRKLIGKGIRWSCWNPDGTVIAYLKNEPGPFSFKDGTTVGLFFYDLATGVHREHVNKEIYHIYNVCWSPCGNWFLATVHGGLGYKHTNLAVQAEGMGVFDIALRGCRPDLSPDGRSVAWGMTDWTLQRADIDLSGPEPKVAGQRPIVVSSSPMMTYHVDWPPTADTWPLLGGPSERGWDCRRPTWAPRPKAGIFAWPTPIIKTAGWRLPPTASGTRNPTGWRSRGPSHETALSPTIFRRPSRE